MTATSSSRDVPPSQLPSQAGPPLVAIAGPALASGTGPIIQEIEDDVAWSVSQSIELSSAEGRAVKKHFPKWIHNGNSRSDTAKRLNAGTLQVEEGFIIIYSATHLAHFLLYKSDSKEIAERAVKHAGERDALMMKNDQAYLPKSINGLDVLVNCGNRSANGAEDGADCMSIEGKIGRWIVAPAQTHASIAYRGSKDLNDRLGDATIGRDDIVEGIDDGDGWILCKKENGEPAQSSVAGPSSEGAAASIAAAFEKNSEPAQSSVSRPSSEEAAASIAAAFEKEEAQFYDLLMCQCVAIFGSDELTREQAKLLFRRAGLDEKVLKAIMSKDRSKGLDAQKMKRLGRLTAHVQADRARFAPAAPSLLSSFANGLSSSLAEVDETLPEQLPKLEGISWNGSKVGVSEDAMRALQNLPPASNSGT